MRKNKRELPVTEIPIDEVEEAPEVVEQCGAWCFLLGAALNAFCQLDRDHEDDHQVDISIFAEPKSHFTVLWVLDD